MTVNQESTAIFEQGQIELVRNFYNIPDGIGGHSISEVRGSPLLKSRQAVGRLLLNHNQYVHCRTNRRRFLQFFGGATLVTPTLLQHHGVEAQSQDEMTLTKNDENALPIRSAEELTTLWERAGYEYRFGEHYYPAPPITLRHLGDIGMYRLGLVDDPDKSFPNLAIAGPLHITSEGAKLVELQGEFVTTSTVKVEDFEAELLHVRMFFGDYERGDITQKVIPTVLGHRTSNYYTGLPIAISLANIGPGRPKVTYDGPPYQPIEQVIQALHEFDKPILMAFRSGFAFPFTKEYQEKAVSLGFPSTPYGVEETRKISEYQETFRNMLQDITLNVARQHGYALYIPGTEGERIDIIEKHTTQLNKSLKLKDMLDAIPDSQHYIDRERLSLNRYLSLPRAGLIHAVVVNDLPIATR